MAWSNPKASPQHHAVLSIISLSCEAYQRPLTSALTSTDCPLAGQVIVLGQSEAKREADNA